MFDENEPIGCLMMYVFLIIAVVFIMILVVQYSMDHTPLP